MSDAYQTAAAADVEGARELLRIANTFPSGDEWLGALQEQSPRAIVGAIGGLDRNRVSGRVAVESFREAARAMVEVKLTEQMVERMEGLERAANRAAWVGVGLTAVGTFVAIVGVVLGVVG